MDALITPVLSQVRDNANSSMTGMRSPKRPVTAVKDGPYS